MIIKLAIASVIALALLIGGGVIEVQVHPDKIAEAPMRLLGLVSEQGNVEQVRSVVIGFKRQIEQNMTKDDSQKFKLALGYMQADAKHLQELTEATTQSPAAIEIQANLLNESVERVRTQAESVPVTTLTQVHDSSRDAFSTAQASLAKLQDLRSTHPDLQAQFERITTSLAGNIEQFTGHVPGGSVAGAQDRTTSPTPSATPRPINAVPLSF